MPRLSIVIPVTESGIERLEETLVSVLENRPESCEVIVVHPGCYHDPYDLSDEVRFVDSAPHTSLVQLANLGIEAAESDILHFLACGALVEEGWVEPALAHFANPDVSSVTPVVLDGCEPTRIAAAGVAYGWGGCRRIVGRGRRMQAGYRPPQQLIGPTLVAAFYRVSALAAVGGLSSAVGSQFADLDVALTLEALGFRTVCEPECHVRAEASLVTPAAGAFAGGWAAQRCFWRHARVRSWSHLLLAHPLLMIAELVADLVRCRLPRALGRLAAMCCAVHDTGHHDRVMQTRQDLLPAGVQSQTNDDTSRREPAQAKRIPWSHGQDRHGESARGRSLRKAG